MRLIHVIESLDPATGGPPAVAVRLAAAQAALGHEVTLACGDEPARAADMADSLVGVPGIDRVRILRWRPSRGVRRMLALEARATLSRLADETRPDWVHLHAVWGPPIRVAAAISRARRVPYLVTPHGMLDVWSLRQKRMKKRLALAAGYRAMLRGAAMIHALSNDEAAHVRRLRLGNPIVVAPNGVFPEEVASAPAREALAARWPAIASGPYVLFLGRLHAKKRPAFLVEAFALAAGRLKRSAGAQARASESDVALVIAGPDEGELPRVREAIARHHLAGRAHVLGPVYGRDRLALVAHAACLALTSVQEGMSVAMLEAMACGVAVIGPFTQPGVALPVTTREALAADLVRLLRDASFRKSVAEAGRSIVRSRFTWPLIAAQLCEAMSPRVRVRAGETGGEKGSSMRQAGP